MRGPRVAHCHSHEQDYEVSERQAHAEATYERLFGPRDNSAPNNDPQLMEILRRFIFGDVFDTGVLVDQTRELCRPTRHAVRPAARRSVPMIGRVGHLQVR
jgi:hypothetical protein